MENIEFIVSSSIAHVMSSLKSQEIGGSFKKQCPQIQSDLGIYERWVANT